MTLCFSSASVKCGVHWVWLPAVPPSPPSLGHPPCLQRATQVEQLRGEVAAKEEALQRLDQENGANLHK